MLPVPVNKHKYLCPWTQRAIMAQINYGHTVMMPRDLLWLQYTVSNDALKIARDGIVSTYHTHVKAKVGTQ